MPRALKRGAYLVAEEFGQIPLETRASLLTIRGQDRVVNPLSGEPLAVPPSFRLLATSNPETMSCRRNSAAAVARALYDDFLSIDCPPLSAEQVRAWLVHNFPRVRQARIDRVIELWEDYRDVGERKTDDDAPGYLTYRAASHLLTLLEAETAEHDAVRIALVGKFATDSELYTAAKLKCSIS